MTPKTYKTKEDVLKQANTALNEGLLKFIPPEDLENVKQKIAEYGSNRKGLFGEFVEKYVFGIKPNNKSEPDFLEAGVELKTNPIKDHPKKTYVSKERLVFSMIDYVEIVKETWETSSFLKKNKVLLIMFYLWVKGLDLLKYRFKFIHLVDLLNDLSDEDIYQIKKDWEYIFQKIKNGHAQYLSEADTYYLGACTKAKTSKVLRDQPNSLIRAKRRAFCFKQQYLNFLIQKHLLKKRVDADSIFKKERRLETIEDVVSNKFAPYIGKTDTEIKKKLKWHPTKRSKDYKRLLAHRIIGVTTKKIEELEKANITMRAITLEHTGTLRESISFPAFDYKDLVTQVWYDEKDKIMSDLHAQLETKKFLFVIFQKIKDSKEIVLKGIKFWNFPMTDLPEAEKVWEKTVNKINEGKYDQLPKISENPVAHVRPHGRDSTDTIETPQRTKEVKRCFWLNAKYIRKELGF